MRTRSLTTALAALALALTAGCGSSADVAGDGDRSSTTSSSASGDVAGGGSDQGATVLTADNFADEISGAQVDAQTTHMTMSMDAMGQAMEAEADVKTDADPDKSAMRMTMNAAGQSVQMVMVDGVIYTQAPGMADGTWMKISLEDAAGAAGASFSQLRESMDPAQSIKVLKDALKSVRDSGETATLDGVEATRYDVVVDTKKLAGMAGAQGVKIPEEITYQYWVGPDQLPRKVVVDLPQTPMEMTFSDWGKDVEITAPPADQVVDGSSMLDGLEQ